jgi:hypothetical protein
MLLVLYPLLLVVVVEGGIEGYITCIMEMLFNSQEQGRGDVVLWIERPAR